MDEWAWQRCFDVNLKGAFFMSQLVGRVMVDENRERGGVIINVGTAIDDDLPPPGLSAYAASKAGLAAFSEACAHELIVMAYAFIPLSLIRPMKYCAFAPKLRAAVGFLFLSAPGVACRWALLVLKDELTDLQIMTPTETFLISVKSNRYGEKWTIR